MNQEDFEVQEVLDWLVDPVCIWRFKSHKVIHWTDAVSICALDANMTPMITPNKPMALAKISMINILTNNLVSCASAKAAPAPKN